MKLLSVITCPDCSFQKEEKMPENYCLLKYRCTNCGKILIPKPGDCCVFCSFGTEKCPPMQDLDV
ncbi:MAG: hypothetical protein KGD59_02355 [Candidatus Heimdallarchaeota archaeon]|nr:hypothetical protein [Candidatus Heimdallarchaeota archaeon]MBY8993364.1 hypothetical protein [Candidatus Heimdallarchaeota archaeon]